MPFHIQKRGSQPSKRSHTRDGCPSLTSCQRHVNEPSAETGKFRWAFTLWFDVKVEPNQLAGFLAAWTPEPDQPETSDAFSHPETWLPALEAQPHPGPLTLPHKLPEA